MDLNLNLLMSVARKEVDAVSDPQTSRALVAMYNVLAHLATQSGTPETGMF